MNTITLLIIDDHKIIRDGIRYMLETEAQQYRFLIREAGNGADGVRMAGEAKHDMVIIDFQMPGMNGADTVKLIMDNNPGTKILMLSSHIEFMYIERLIKTGVKGILLKDVIADEFILAITSIMKGETYFSKDVAQKMMHYQSKRAQKPIGEQGETKAAALSEREIEILQLIAAGNSSKDIADKLGLSKRTIDTHRANISKKLNVQNTAGLVKYAIDYFARH